MTPPQNQPISPKAREAELLRKWTVQRAQYNARDWMFLCEWYELFDAAIESLTLKQTLSKQAAAHEVEIKKYEEVVKAASNLSIRVSMVNRGVAELVELIGLNHEVRDALQNLTKGK